MGKKKKNKGGSLRKMKCMSIRGANASFSKMPCLSHEEKISCNNAQCKYTKKYLLVIYV
jgi:hypothetical protein